MRVLIFILVSVYSCKQGPSNFHESNKTDSRNFNKSKYRSIQDLFWNKSEDLWNSNGIQLYLKSERLQVFYNPQCMYSYPAKIEGNQIVYYWEYEMDCTFDRELNKDFSRVSSPQVGDKFAALSLVDDEILEVSYYFPEWVASMNEYSTDVIALFPRYFYLKK